MTSIRIRGWSSFYMGSNLNSEWWLWAGIVIDALSKRYSDHDDEAILKTPRSASCEEKQYYPGPSMWSRFQPGGGNCWWLGDRCSHKLWSGESFTWFAIQDKPLDQSVDFPRVCFPGFGCRSCGLPSSHWSASTLPQRLWSTPQSHDLIQSLLGYWVSNRALLRPAEIWSRYPHGEHTSEHRTTI